MADVIISYKNAEIATMNATGVKTLLTGDTFCEDDIVVAYTKPSTPAPTLQAKTVYPSASDQTTTPDQGYDGLSSVTYKGVLLTNLTAGNIKKDVVVKVGDSADDDRITSVTGTYEGSGGGGPTVITGNDGVFSLSGTGITDLSDLAGRAIIKVDEMSFDNNIDITRPTFFAISPIDSSIGYGLVGGANIDDSNNYCSFFAEGIFSNGLYGDEFVFDKWTLWCQDEYHGASQFGSWGSQTLYIFPTS